MRAVFLVLSAVLAASYCGALRADGPPPRTDWTKLFPAPMPNYNITFGPPVVAKGDSPVVYRLTAQYDWLGDDFRVATATMARDPDFKTLYAAEAMKKAGALEIVVGKRTAWLRSPNPAGGRSECELIVVLSDDKALILTSMGHFGDTALRSLAEQFDLAAVEAALANPPAAGPSVDKPK